MREDSVNLGEIAASAAAGAGVVWALRRSSELYANLVCFGVGGGVGEHVNAEVDVILVDISGSSKWKVKSIPYRRDHDLRSTGRPAFDQRRVRRFRLPERSSSSGITADRGLSRRRADARKQGKPSRF